jgi:hypothetical protein
MMIYVTQYPFSMAEARVNERRDSLEGQQSSPWIKLDLNHPLSSLEQSQLLAQVADHVKILVYRSLNHNLEDQIGRLNLSQSV